MQVEKRRLLHVFLKQFLVVYKNWEPVNSGQISEAASTTIQPAESDDVVIGCFAGHPAEVILVLTEEITQLTAMVVECKLNSVYQIAMVCMCCCIKWFLLNFCKREFLSLSYDIFWFMRDKP